MCCFFFCCSLRALNLKWKSLAHRADFSIQFDCIHWFHDLSSTITLSLRLVAPLQLIYSHRCHTYVIDTSTVCSLYCVLLQPLLLICCCCFFSNLSCICSIAVICFQAFQFEQYYNAITAFICCNCVFIKCYLMKSQTQMWSSLSLWQQTFPLKHNVMTAFRTPTHHSYVQSNEWFYTEKSGLLKHLMRCEMKFYHWISLTFSIDFGKGHFGILCFFRISWDKNQTENVWSEQNFMNVKRNIESRLNTEDKLRTQWC